MSVQEAQAAIEGANGCAWIRFSPHLPKPTHLLQVRVAQQHHHRGLGIFSGPKSPQDYNSQTRVSCAELCLPLLS
jgi:hypothetical protein